MRRRLVMTAAEIIASRPQSKNQIGAWCNTCDGPSDREEIVDMQRGKVNRATVKVQCHGDEEVGVFEFDTKGWNHNDLKRAMQRRTWFDPSEGLGNILNGGRIR